MSTTTTREGVEAFRLPNSLLNVAEAAAYLRVSRATLYNMVRNGSLKARKLKGVDGLRFRISDLDAATEPLRVAPNAGAQASRAA